MNTNTDQPWGGHPGDKPGLTEAERSAWQGFDEAETRKVIGIECGDRLTIRPMRPAYVVPPMSPEEQEAARLANVRGLVNLRELSGLSPEEWAERFT